MHGERLARLLRSWVPAYLGCAAFLIVGSLAEVSWSPALLVELGWLALLGSIPTSAALALAASCSNAGRRIVAGGALLVLVSTFALAWEHTDFLLSGPQWSVHPHRLLARIVMGFGIGASAAVGWVWLVAGARVEAGPKALGWTAGTVAAIAVLVHVMSRYHAYDFSMAQLVLPGGLLCAALVQRLIDGRNPPRAALALSVACAVVSIGSRFVPGLPAEGARETVAHSRAGALVSLHVVPRLGGPDDWSGASLDCPKHELLVERAPIPISAQSRRNVIIITVDALRKDAVTKKVRGEPLMPELSFWAARGVSYRDATTTYPATLFAVGSSFTGLTPAELYLSPAIPETIFTRSRGTVDRQLVVLPDVSWFRLPIVRDFLVPGADVAFARTDGSATATLVRQLRDARRLDQSVMAWIHYYAPHAPYRAHPSFPVGKGKKNQYWSEVAYFDSQLGSLMRYLDEDGWLEDTLVVFFSDHGEALGERGYYGHHVYLDGWMIDVPLVIWHAGLEPSAPRVAASLADVAPTVLHFLGLPRETDLPSRSLFTLDPSMPNRATYSEAFPVRGRALFDSFRLPSLDDETIRSRLRGIRTASKGYEPKGAVTQGAFRLIHHRSADQSWAYERSVGTTEPVVEDADVTGRLSKELEAWEAAQMERIGCRLRLSARGPQ